MLNDQHQRGRAVVNDRGRFRSAKERERILDVSAAATALARHEIIFEIGVGRTDFFERLDRLRRKRRAPNVRVNDDPGPVDDRLQPAGAKLLERTAYKIDNRSEFGNLAFRANPRKFLPDDGDDDRPRKIDFA